MPGTDQLVGLDNTCAFGSYASLSDIGRVRSNNEDVAAIVESTDGRVLMAIVVDGMGGYEGGELAASITAGTFVDMMCGTLPGDTESIYEHLLRCFYDADSKIRAYVDYPSMGATVVAALVWRDRLLYLHAGDTRCYVFRDGKVVLKSADHSVAASVSALSGGMDGAPSEVFSSMVTSCVGGPGQFGNLTVDPGWDSDRCLAAYDLLPGDVVLMCSDGLWNNVPDESMREMVLCNPQSPSILAGRLVAAALAAGGSDNITVAVIVIAGEQVRPMDDP